MDDARTRRIADDMEGGLDGIVAGLLAELLGELERYLGAWNDFARLYGV